MTSAANQVAKKDSQSLGNFLKLHGSSTANHLVLGNEAGDADSIVSALSLAYVDSFQVPKSPLVSVSRADLCLRRETVLLLELAGVDTDDLVYIDDLVDDETTEQRKLTLVDHNSLTQKFRDLFDVVEIIDHHHDLGDHSNVKGDARDIAFEDDKALVGSTCTLVAERMIKNMEPLYNSDLSLLLLGVILLDTVNMSVEAGKGTARDRAAIDTILEKTDWSSLSDAANFLRTTSDAPDPLKIYEYLRDSKFDPVFWDGLSVTDALRLDFKRFEADSPQDVFGASSLLLPLSSFVSKPNLVESLELFLETSNVPLLAISSMTMVNDVPQRELLFCGNDKKLVEGMASYLMKNEVMDLTEVKTVDGGDNLTLRQFQQGNVRASRKQFAPIMLQFYSRE